MKLKEAAFIIGSLGGRPPTKPVVVHYERRRGGFLETFRLQLEDGSGFLLLEDGFYLLLE